MGYDMFTAKEDAYFRLNIWGMAAAREAMRVVGMLTDDPMPDWPELSDFGTNAEEVCKYSADDKAAPDGVRAYRAAERATLDGDADEPAGIPTYKLCSNDGWLVTEREITAALTRYDSLSEAERVTAVRGLAWWPEWLGYLRKAAKTGGFRVW